MIALPLGAATADEAVRVVRALGAHRYVAGRMHLVHALALAAVGESEPLAEARAWALSVLGNPALDPASRDEALWRRCSDPELGAVVAGFWLPGDASARARLELEALLARHGLDAGADAPFDESREDEMHPVLVDAGWELLRLGELDAERHRGAIASYGEALAFESARFEEETAIPPEAHLYELPALGPAELLRGASADGALAEPLVVWAEGDGTYLDYVLRGVRRAARLPETDPEDG